MVKVTETHAPYTHSLAFLASKLNFDIPEHITTNFAVFMEFHIEARYPEEQKKFYKKCTKPFTLRNLNEIKKVYKWLAQKLKES